MMEKDETLKDEFLHKLMQKSTLEGPSVDFTDKVMAALEAMPELTPARKPFYLYLKAAVPYVVLAVILFVIVYTSDFPFMQWIPGKEVFTNNFILFFSAIFDSMKLILFSKYTSFGLMIGLSAGVWIMIDLLFKRKTVGRQNSAI
jgi:hypothetical protein